MNRLEINRFNLNFGWNFIPSFDEKYIKEFPESELVNIPHSNIEFQFNNFSENNYQFISSYKKDFEIDKQPFIRYILHFDGVMNFSIVYLNEKLVISHKGGFTPFSKDITEYLTSGSNKLFVMVDSTELTNTPPHGGALDFLTYGGIYREVYIEEKELNFIDNAFVDVVAGAIEIRMFLDFKNRKSSIFTFNIYDEHKFVHSFQREYILKKEIKVEEVFELERWTLDSPKLYTLEILIKDKLSYTTRFANRSIKITNDGFFLNNNQVMLRGLNRHQSYPYVGYAMPSNAQIKDADILKYELGVNVVRSSHYPPSKHFLDRCDEIGLLVFNETPGYRYIGDKEWQEVVKKNVYEMIYRDYNHPSVFIWGVRINESEDNNELYLAIKKIAKKLDPYRPTGGARNIFGSNLIEDVYAFNDYSHNGNNKGILSPIKVAKRPVPYIISEHTGYTFPTKKFDSVEVRLSQATRHLKVMNDAYKNSNVAAVIGTSMCDYNTQRGFGSGDGISYHGVMDMFRIPKFAAKVYRCQDDSTPFLDVLANQNSGKNQLTTTKELFVLTNVEYIKFYINDVLIKNFYPSKKQSFILYPPIIVDDFIGNLILENENFNKKDSTRIKTILLSLMKHNHKLSTYHRVQLLIFKLKNNLNKKEIEQLYYKYIGKLNIEPTVYRFDAFNDHKLVKTKMTGTNYTSSLFVKVDNDILEEDSTYQTTRVVVKHLDEFSNPLIYTNEVINIDITGPLKLIGPSKLPLVGGSIGFYVKTVGKKGKAKITISAISFRKKIVNIKIL